MVGPIFLFARTHSCTSTTPSSTSIPYFLTPLSFLLSLQFPNPNRDRNPQCFPETPPPLPPPPPPPPTPPVIHNITRFRSSLRLCNPSLPPCQSHRVDLLPAVQKPTPWKMTFHCSTPSTSYIRSGGTIGTSRRRPTVAYVRTLLPLPDPHGPSLTFPP